ncbi:hypothetical protein BC940DRAFT_330688 [Gongronella butleri]|nr:hypothetical protein BC940DRAFT_330688 [Gongronella butleri]
MILLASPCLLWLFDAVVAAPVAPVIHQHIVPTFPTGSHDSQSFTTVHIIAAVIGIVGALILIAWCAIFYVRRRQREHEMRHQVLQEQQYLPPPPLACHDGACNGCSACISDLKRMATSPTTPNVPEMVHRPIDPMQHAIPSKKDAQFYTFASDYYLYQSSSSNDTHSSQLLAPPAPSYHASLSPPLYQHARDQQ